MLNSSNIISGQERVLIWLHFAMIMVIYASVGYFSPGFDDEYFNIVVVERFGTEVFEFIQKTDAHPPLSYILNAWLLKFLGRWELVRMISGILTSTAIIATISQIGKGKSTKFTLILIYLLAFNPALLMWGTSLRWYSYILPILIWLVVIPKNSKWHWPKFFLSVFLMGLLGHIIYFIFASIFLYYWFKDEREIKQKTKAILSPAILTLIAYIPQLIIFFKYYFPRRGGQTFSFSSSILGILSSSFSNQGLFPLSPGGLISTLGSVVIFVHLISKIKDEWRRPYFIPYAFGQAILLFTGIAGKMRNMVVMIPMQAIWFSEKINATVSRWITIAITMIVFGNILGMYNVITHEDTSKNSWNIPVVQLKEFVSSSYSYEKSATLIYCHDPIITWHLEKSGYLVRSPYAVKEVNLENKKFKQVMVIWTNPGNLPKKRMELYHFEISLLKRSSQTDYILGTDRYAAIKRKKDPQYPDELVKISVLNDPENISASTIWSPTFINRLK